ncbi:WD-40 repeat-containing protein [Fomitopsis serialis]|uniref:WD-40 repeat-containing protein n=1 Tax=Fomitopsis serialis TaxID=139415 RepID=UPI002008060D|nr:WD-40 repeat-containing protein [Neoantrodia serialis]KAH9937709.1 WD-40 repeat-containing protein [Neoantrodia serialis]
MTAFDTVWPADSVEFCPHPSYHNVFVCGTYNLEQPAHTIDNEPNEGTPPPAERPKQKRTGECLLFGVDAEDELQFPLLQKTSLPAILDMKWCHTSPSVDPILAIADSEGGITLHALRGKQSQPSFEQTFSIACASKDRRYPSSSLGSLIVSLSDGSLALLRPENSSGLIVAESWHAHDHEPWIAAWNYWDTNVVTQAWDVRQDFTQPLFVNKRFDAGITTIQSHPYVEHLLAVGSYDNTVRLFDVRKPLVPVVEADVGGGAWRVKWHPSPERKTDLLVACMHDGFKIVRFGLGGESEPSGKQWDVVNRFDQHESLAYGVDWSFARGSVGGDTLVASCSFYDHKLHLWRG